LNPSAKGTSLKTELTTYFLKTNNPIQHFNDSSMNVVVIPPERSVELASIINNKNVNFENKDKITIYISTLDQYNLIHFPMISDDVLAKYKIPQNSVLIIYGLFTLKSEAPVECMTSNYTNGMTMNYFSCDQCKINWICAACSEHCHKGHTLLPYLTNHKTTWACCYCVSKGFCKALNKNNKK